MTTGAYGGASMVIPVAIIAIVAWPAILVLALVALVVVVAMMLAAWLVDR